jgi:hypothetical protein
MLIFNCRPAGKLTDGFCLPNGRPMSEVLPTKTRDGFRVLQARVELPFDNAALDPELQTDLLICHLFVNDGRSIEAIARIGLDRERVVEALLEHGAIQDRRRGSCESSPRKKQVFQRTDQNSVSTAENIESWASTRLYNGTGPRGPKDAGSSRRFHFHLLGLS